MLTRKKINTLKSGISSNELTGKRVLLRLDLNIPMKKNKTIDANDEWRIIATLPTLKYLIAQKAKIIIITHLGRPGGRVEESLRLEPVGKKLAEFLGVSIRLMSDCLGEKVQRAIAEMSAGELLMLENLRFHAGEEKNETEFAKSLATLGDIYINEAFSDSHREHASIVGITKYLPSYAGFLMEKEYESLSLVLKPTSPSVAIIGGAKIETKIPVIDSLSKIYDYVIIGGMIANEMIDFSSGKAIAPNVLLPLKDDLKKQRYFDIGVISINLFSKFIREAKSIVWNGPMGKFEENEFSRGTLGIIEALKIAYNSGSRIAIGGGETVAAVQKFAPEFFEYKDRIYISTGGGAMLEFLAGKNLPGIEALKI